MNDSRSDFIRPSD